MLGTWYQSTIRHSISLSGVGVHAGKPVVLTVRPAPPDTGVVFRRVDQPGACDVPARAMCVGETPFSTVLVRQGVRVATVEHVLSAVSGMGIDNVFLDLNNEEVPIMDGSAACFVFALQAAGRVELPVPRRFMRIKRKITVQHDDSEVTLEPCDHFRVQVSIQFDHPLFQGREQTGLLDSRCMSFVSDISRARTFGFLKQYSMLRKRNMAGGTSTDNTVLLDDARVINPEGLRFPDELVRHKILDAMGDLHLLGHPILGAFTGLKSGHKLNNALVQTVMADTSCWDVVTFENATWGSHGP